MGTLKLSNFWLIPVPTVTGAWPIEYDPLFCQAWKRNSGSFTDWLVVHKLFRTKMLHFTKTMSVAKWLDFFGWTAVQSDFVFGLWFEAIDHRTDEFYMYTWTPPSEKLLWLHLRQVYIYIYIQIHIVFYICVHSYSTCASEIYLLHQQFYIRRFETLRLWSLQYVMKRFWVVTTSWTVHCLVVCSVCLRRVSKLQNAFGQETCSGHVRASWPQSIPAITKLPSKI